MIYAKENLDGDLMSFVRNGSMDSFTSFSKILSSTLKDQTGYKFPELKPVIKIPSKEASGSITSSAISSPPDSSTTGYGKFYCQLGGSADFMFFLIYGMVKLALR